MNYKIIGKKTDNVELIAPAKVNLFLYVGNKRRDGYHDLTTLMQETDLCDRIKMRLTCGSAISVRVVPPVKGVPLGSGNIVYRAVEAFRGFTGCGKGVDISIKKRIPAGAGLGGGSSDAASTLIGLDALLGTKLGSCRLARIAAEVGSDVPFFIYGKTALCRGRGEIVAPWPFKGRLHYIIAYPGIPVSTGLVYKNFRNNLTNRQLYGRINLEEWEGAVYINGSMLFNSLEPAVFKLFPDLKKISLIMQACAGTNSVLLSGSGSAIYVLCKSKKITLKTYKVIGRELRTKMGKAITVFTATTL